MNKSIAGQARESKNSARVAASCSELKDLIVSAGIVCLNGESIGILQPLWHGNGRYCSGQHALWRISETARNGSNSCRSRQGSVRNGHSSLRNQAKILRCWRVATSFPVRRSGISAGVLLPACPTYSFKTAVAIWGCRRWIWGKAVLPHSRKYPHSDSCVWNVCRYSTVSNSSKSRNSR